VTWILSTRDRPIDGTNPSIVTRERALDLIRSNREMLQRWNDEILAGVRQGEMGVEYGSPVFRRCPGVNGFAGAVDALADYPLRRLVDDSVLRKRVTLRIDLTQTTPEVAIKRESKLVPGAFFVAERCEQTRVHAVLVRDSVEGWDQWGKERLVQWFDEVLMAKINRSHERTSKRRKPSS
jgi:hypothetical protein